MTTVQDVIANIKNTIVGKEMLLAAVKTQLDPIRMSGETQHLVNELVLETTEKILVLSLSDLHGILADLEKCVDN